MGEIAEPCPPPSETPRAVRRITVTISEDDFVRLAMAKLFTRKTFNALVAEGIQLVEEKYRSERGEGT